MLAKPGMAQPAEATPHRARAQGWIRPLSTLTVFSVFGLVVLGGVVRVTGSGLGCPDWPLCYGRVVPPWELTALIEYSHRMVASAIVGPLVLLTCGVSWLAHRHPQRPPLPLITSLTKTGQRHPREVPVGCAGIVLKRTGRDHDLG